MPIQISEAKTPKGQKYMRALVSGKVTLADAQAMSAMLSPGAPLHMTRVLNLVDKSTEYSPDSRKHFATMKGTYKRMATVVASAVVRAVINFQLRIAGDSGEFRLFNTEEEAMAWLDAD